ncbi:MULTISPECIES: phosphopantetheine-binding protein [Streptomyces]|jgi:acyl carrier protein|uniref:Acyl carrier protein n=3 Tax=Streptomyces rochei group TaxID=2867164 RepID=A0A0U3UIP7_STRRO|nr:MULTISPECIES: phosphopantetheine-binding protein [Streptomyces]RIH59315.1 acyl carrier protein [Streptomyces sp. SHP22-7]WDI21428.1 phosphopantetheine-binding protein [Streptomyces enissocaesilis]ALV82381.1 acyl carrier protein [Streptomyces rochei]KYK14661.1 acyl carrier protein [Streptomyces sp. CC71]MBJ6622097.1 acyl carrier protein [Streptomyces sp. DHE17-7]
MSTDPKSVVHGILAEDLEVDPAEIADGALLRDLDLDSLAVAELIVRIKEETGVDLGGEETRVADLTVAEVVSLAGAGLEAA